MGVRGVRVADDVRRVIRRRRREGESSVALQSEFGICGVTVWRIVNEDDPMLMSSCCRSSRFLSMSERETISRQLALGSTCGVIAALLGRHRSSISREVAANGGSQAYRAVDAEARACRLAARAKATKLESHPVLAATVTDWMQDQQWSPEQISGRLPEEFPAGEIFYLEEPHKHTLLKPAHEREQGFRHLAWVDFRERLKGHLWAPLLLGVALIIAGLVNLSRGFDPDRA